LIATFNDSGEIQVWLRSNGKLIYTRKPNTNNNSANAIRYAIKNVTFSPDGQTLVSKIGTKIDVFNAADGQHRYSLSNKGSFSISPDGKFLVFGGFRIPITFYQLSNGTFVRQLEVNGNPHFSPDSQLLAIWGSTSYKTKYVEGILLYRLEDNQLLGYVPTPQKPYNIIFSPNEKFLAASYSTGGGGDAGGLFVALSSSPKPSWSHLAVWQLVPFADKDYSLQVAKVKSKKDSYFPFAFTPDSKFVVTGSATQIRFWQVPPRNYTWLWLLASGALAAFFNLCDLTFL
jgi:WD40 repeat protein